MWWRMEGPILECNLQTNENMKIIDADGDGVVFIGAFLPTLIAYLDHFGGGDVRAVPIWGERDAKNG